MPMNKAAKTAAPPAAEPRKAAAAPDVQLIANLVIVDRRGRVLLAPDDEAPRWWLPGAQLRPYEHPDDALHRALADTITAADAQAAHPTLHHIESFRGRRGWHVMFNHRLKARAAAAHKGCEWFDAGQLPRLAHGAWEREVIARVLG
jgi:ADP-ribose pyrophosphatase YjhB (NUDIX family)